MANRLPSRFATRMAASFGGLLVLGVLLVVYLWYAGLPPLGIKGVHEQRHEMAARLLQLQADIHVQRIGDFLRERRGDVLVVAENRVLTAALREDTPNLSADFQRVFDRLQRAYPDIYTGMMLLDHQGKVRIASDEALPEDLVELNDFVLRANQPGVMELIEQTPTRHGPSLVITRQLLAPDAQGMPGNEHVGILVVLLDIRQFTELSKNLTHGGNELLLRDSAGQVLSSSLPMPVNITDLPPVADGFEGILNQAIPGGEPGIVVYRHFQLNGTQGWTLLHFTTVREAIGRLDRLVLSTLLTAGLVAVLGVLAIYIGVRRLTRPLSQLTFVAQHFGEGDRGQRFHHPRGESWEVHQLGKAFNAMADQIVLAQNTLETQVIERTRETATARDQLLATLDALPDLLFEVDINGSIYSYHSNHHNLLAVTPDLFLGKTFSDVLPPDVAATCLSAIQQAHQDGWSTGAEYALDLPEGRRWFEASVSRRNTNEHGTHRFVFLARDITARKQAEAEVLRLALFDPLTGLANRRLMTDRLDQARLSSERSAHFNGLVLIDLDHFKDINDTLGHNVGDQLLIAAAQRFTACVREGDTVARLGGDEFVLILRDFAADAAIAALQIERVVEKIRHEFSRSFTLRTGNEEERSLHVTLSVGIYPFNNASVSVDELLKCADTAMYQAKQGGRNAYRFFDPSMQESVLLRAALDEQLREAIEREQFRVYLQPLVDTTGNCLGAELLLRWQHPTRGLVGPVEFIAPLEQSGLIVPLGQWVLRQACTTLASWASHPEFASLTLAVNVSARQVSRPDFVDHTLATLQNAGVDAKKLKLELTESLLQANMAETIDKMAALQAIGIRFALDDFGTGYSSLTYLKRLPLAELKIDRSFVRDLLDDSHDLAIAQLILGLGQTLGLRVLAEGVELQAQHERLLAMGCDAFQGYLFGKPMPMDDFENWVRHRSAALR